MRLAAQGPPPGARAGAAAPAGQATGGPGQGGRDVVRQRSRPSSGAPGDPAMIARGKTLLKQLPRLPRRRPPWRRHGRRQPAALAARAQRSERRADSAGRPERPAESRYAGDAAAPHAGGRCEGGGGVYPQRRGDARGQGDPPAGAEVELNIVVGDAAAGQAVLHRQLRELPLATGDLRGSPRRMSSRSSSRTPGLPAAAAAAAAAAAPAARRAGERRPSRVTAASGATVNGEGRSIASTSSSSAALPDGTTRSFRRIGDVPKVEITDPLEGHKKLWPSSRTRTCTT